MCLRRLDLLWNTSKQRGQLHLLTRPRTHLEAQGQLDVALSNLSGMYDTHMLSKFCCVAEAFQVEVPGEHHGRRGLVDTL